MCWWHVVAVHASDLLKVCADLGAPRGPALLLQLQPHTLAPGGVLLVSTPTRTPYKHFRATAQDGDPGRWLCVALTLLQMVDDTWALHLLLTCLTAVSGAVVQQTL